MQCPDNRCKGKPCMAAICNLGCSCDIVTYRLKWPRGRIAHAHVLHRLYLYTLSLLSLRLSSAIKKLSWTMSLYISTNCYYILFSQQQLGHVGTFQITAHYRDGSERFYQKYRHRCNVQMIGARGVTGPNQSYQWSEVSTQQSLLMANANC